MAIKDQIKWDNKYKKTPKLLLQRDPSKKLIEAIKHVKGKKVLDLACGAGKNSIYLAKKGFEIDAMDISQVALDEIEKKGYKNINTHLIDLEGYEVKTNHYDLIVKTNYLDREILPSLKSALKKDGILFIETYMHHENNEKPNSNPAFLLQKNELKSFFQQGFEIISYDEFDNDKDELYRMKKQAIVVKKT